MNMKPFIAVFLGYLLGSFPTGYIVGIWLGGIDLRILGSKSTGATNVLRQVGSKAALFVFLIDVFKGTIAILLAQRLLINNYSLLNSADWWIVISGFAALSGHIWPIWLKGKGGKAVATSLGILLGINWVLGLECFIIFLSCFSVSRTVSISSVLTALTLPLLMIKGYIKEVNNVELAYLILSWLTAIIVIWRHRSNVNRLIKGTETQIKANIKK